jgi:hypothetical protein
MMGFVWLKRFENLVSKLRPRKYGYHSYNIVVSVHVLSRSNKHIEYGIIVFYEITLDLCIAFLDFD